MVDDVLRNRVVGEAIGKVTLVDERMADVMTTLRDCEGVVHMVVIETNDVGNSNSTLHLSENYSVMTVVVAACSLLQQAAAMMRSSNNNNLDDHLEAVDSAVNLLADGFEVDLDKLDLLNLSSTRQ